MFFSFTYRIGFTLLCQHVNPSQLSQDQAAVTHLYQGNDEDTAINMNQILKMNINDGGQ